MKGLDGVGTEVGVVVTGIGGVVMTMMSGIAQTRPLMRNVCVWDDDERVG